MEASSAPAPPFTITRQDHQAVYDDANPNATAWTIYFTTRGGTASFITVPDSQYNADTVAQLLTQRAAQIDAVGALGSPSS